MLVLIIDIIICCQVAGVPNNINFLQKLANHRAFGIGIVETHFIEQHKDDLFVDPSQSVLAKEANSAVRFSAVLVAACICVKEHSALKESPHGTLKVSILSWDLCLLFHKILLNIHLVMCPGGHGLLSPWYAHPPFRVHHHVRRIMEFEWENEYDSSGSKLFRLSVTYQPDGNYLIEVLTSFECIDGVAGQFLRLPCF